MDFSGKVVLVPSNSKYSLTIQKDNPNGTPQPKTMSSKCFQKSSRPRFKLTNITVLNKQKKIITSSHQFPLHPWISVLQITWPFFQLCSFVYCSFLFETLSQSIQLPGESKRIKNAEFELLKLEYIPIVSASEGD